jgi:uncharacterized protein involved in exopolysaccharide biosynthesis
LGAALNPQGQNPEMQAMQQQMMMMQQMMMQQMMQNQPGGAQAAAPAAASGAAPANPQTREEVQALIDSLDAKLASGELSEAVYQRLVAKWEERLKGMQ